MWLASTHMPTYIHNVCMWVCVYTYSSSYIYTFWRYGMWHNWFTLLILYSVIQYLQKKVFLGIKFKMSCFHIMQHNTFFIWCSDFAADFMNLGGKTFAWIDDRGGCVDTQREFVYSLPPSEVINSYRNLPEDVIEIQRFDQGHFSGTEARF